MNPHFSAIINAVLNSCQCLFPLGGAASYNVDSWVNGGTRLLFGFEHILDLLYFCLFESRNPYPGLFRYTGCDLIDKYLTALLTS